MINTTEHMEMPWRFFWHEVKLKDWASLILYIIPIYILKTIIVKHSIWIFGFIKHLSRPFGKPKEPFFAHRTMLSYSIKLDTLITIK
jgi:hypothetical protein